MKKNIEPQLGEKNKLSEVIRKTYQVPICFLIKTNKTTTKISAVKVAIARRIVLKELSFFPLILLRSSGVKFFSIAFNQAAAIPVTGGTVSSFLSGNA